MRRAILAAALLGALAGCDQDAATLAQWVENSLEGNRVGEAERFAARLKAKDPDGAPTHAALAAVATRKRDFGTAEREWRAAIEASRQTGGTLRYHFRLGLMLMDAGRYADAELEFAGVSQFEPRNRAARYWRARAAAHATRYADAVAAFDETLKLDPNHLQARIERAAALYALGDLGTAAREVNWLRDRAPTDAYVRVLDGLIDRRRGEVKSAEAALRKALELQKRTAAPHVALADLLLAQGRLDEAGTALQGLPRGAAEAAGVLLRQGRLARLKGDRAGAAALLERALAACPAGPTGPAWPDAARVDFYPAELRAAITAELEAARGVASAPASQRR